MDRPKTLELKFTEEEAYELLMRCVSHDEEDNQAFSSALRKLADAIKSCKLRAAA